MAAVPIRAQYGPTLGQLLAPSWRAARPAARVAVIAGVLGLLLLLVGVGLTLENASFSHSGRPAFSFEYRGLYRARPRGREYVRLQRLAPDGSLEDLFTVQPLQLPPYSGFASGELPLYAAGYIRSLSDSYAGFQLRGEGQSKVNVESAYDIYFTTTAAGHLEYGRVVLDLPGSSHVREGVAITALTSLAPRYALTAPPEVAAVGLLARALRSFSFG